jgi:hypothetical protein
VAGCSVCEGQVVRVPSVREVIQHGLKIVGFEH